MSLEEKSRVKAAEPLFAQAMEPVEPVEVEFSELLRCGARFFSLLSRSLEQIAEDCSLEERIADLEENLRRLKKQR